MKSNQKIPLLIDFDGVLKIGDKPAEDASEFLNYLKQNNIPSYILSNSTLRTSKDLLKFLSDNKIDYGIPALTAVDAALNYVKKNYKKISVYCRESIKTVFKDLETDDDPDAVVVGDLGENWNYKTMNEIFRKVHSGADLIAMQKNKFWKPWGDKLFMDAGAFITAIEYATEKKSILIGKPSPLFFQSALNEMGYKNNNPFIMIGDDIVTDINAAQNIGGKGILVYTGKTKYPLTNDSIPKPNYEAKNLTEVINILEKIY